MKLNTILRLYFMRLYKKVSFKLDRDKEEN